MGVKTAAMKKRLAFFLGLILFICPIGVQAEEESPAPEQMSEDALNYLMSEDMYQGTLSWQGNKVSTKFNYDKIKIKR